jgi:hypothetical protein
MNSVLVSLSAFLAIFCSALIGLWAAPRLPEPHLNSETRTAVSVSMAVVGTLAALVLGLMISSASTSFRARTDAVESLAVDIIKLNRALQRYGPEAASARDTLQAYAQSKIHELSDRIEGAGLGLGALHILETINDQVLALRPNNDRERHIQGNALQLIDAISNARWLLVEKNSLAVPPQFMALLIFWLSLLFASFGLFAPRNTTVIITLLLCAVAISGGILMILELGNPTRGLIQPSVAPLNMAIGEIAPGGN